MFCNGSFIHLQFRLMKIASAKSCIMRTQFASGLTDLVSLLWSTREPSVWVGHFAVFHRDRDSGNGVPHRSRCRAALSALKFPPVSCSNLTGSDTCNRGQTTAARSWLGQRIWEVPHPSVGAMSSSPSMIQHHDRLTEQSFILNRGVLVAQVDVFPLSLSTLKSPTTLLT